MGDWEGDTVLGAVGKGGIVTFAYRKTRYLVAWLIPDKVESLDTQFATWALVFIEVLLLALIAF